MDEEVVEVEGVEEEGVEVEGVPTGVLGPAVGPWVASLHMSSTQSPGQSQI